MSNVNDIIKSGDINLIATLLVAVAFGWKAATQEDVVEDEQEAPFVLSVEAEEIPGVTTVTTADHEQEREYARFVWTQDEQGFPVQLVVDEVDDGASVDQPYWTRSGDNPVIHDQAQQADLDRSAAGFMPEQVADLGGKPYTHTSKWGNGKRQERNFFAVLNFILSNEDNSARLQAGWKRLWARVYAQENHSFLFPSQVKCLRGEFQKRGIVSKKQSK